MAKVKAKTPFVFKSRDSGRKVQPDRFQAYSYTVMSGFVLCLPVRGFAAVIKAARIPAVWHRCNRTRGGNMACTQILGNAENAMPCS